MEHREALPATAWTVEIPDTPWIWAGVLLALVALSLTWFGLCLSGGPRLQAVTRGAHPAGHAFFLGLLLIGVAAAFGGLWWLDPKTALGRGLGAEVVEGVVPERADGVGHVVVSDIGVRRPCDVVVVDGRWDVTCGPVLGPITRRDVSTRAAFEKSFGVTVLDELPTADGTNAQIALLVNEAVVMCAVAVVSDQWVVTCPDEDGRARAWPVQELGHDRATMPERDSQTDPAPAATLP